MSESKLTILMPAYNVAGYIGEAIESVLSQDFRDYELLIIDDGSTDATVEIINSYPDARIRLLQQPHQGIAAALNYGLQQATGDYVARFDADDICLQGRFRKQVSFLDNNPAHIVCGGNAEYIAANGEHLFNYTCNGYTHEQIIKNLLTHCPFIHSAVMYRKQPVLKAGGYNARAHNFEDHFLWTQMAALGKFANLQESLIKVRFNPSSVTIDEKWRGKAFRDLKSKILSRSSVTEAEGETLLEILQKQDRPRIKKGAYYALCGKKFLLNNHQPAKARSYLRKAIQFHPLRWDNYALYLISFMPQSFIDWLHRKQSIQLLPS